MDGLIQVASYAVLLVLVALLAAKFGSWRTKKSFEMMPGVFPHQVIGRHFLVSKRIPSGCDTGYGAIELQFDVVSSWTSKVRRETYTFEARGEGDVPIEEGAIVRVIEITPLGTVIVSPVI